MLTCCCYYIVCNKSITATRKVRSNSMHLSGMHLATYCPRCEFSVSCCPSSTIFCMLSRYHLLMFVTSSSNQNVRHHHFPSQERPVRSSPQLKMNLCLLQDVEFIKKETRNFKDYFTLFEAVYSTFFCTFLPSYHITVI